MGKAMDSNNMTEGTARFTFTAACGMSIFATGAAMMLRLRDESVPSAIFLAISFVACAITLVSYRRYKALRDVRWQRELKAGDDQLGQILNHARMNILVEHITGPLNAEMVGASSEVPAQQTVDSSE